MKSGITILASLVLLVPAAASAQTDDYRVSLLIPVDPGPDPAARGGLENISDIIYVNRCVGNCLVRKGGFDNAITNTSSIIATDVTLTEFGHGQDVFDQTIECLRQVYLPYNVRIVTEDPGNVTHHEAILAGTPTEAGFEPNVGGVAPFTCGPRNNMISYSFANGVPGDFIDLCWTVAQESAHAFGLDHEFDCSDPMTYIPNCGQKFFRNESYACGEFESRGCLCGGTLQNSHAKMLEVFGEGGPVPAPTVEVLLPADGSQVDRDDAIYVKAEDARLVSKIDVYINGFLFDVIEGFDFFDARDRNNTYTVSVGSLNHPDGVMNIEFVASNDLGLSSTATLTVTKGEPCVSADTCLDGQFCEGGGCFYPEPTGAIGDTCVRNMDCVSLQCAQAAGEQLCTQACFLGIEGQCPEGFDCLPASTGSGLCWPKAEVEDGGCSAGAGGPTAGQLALFALVFGLLLVRRRR